MDEAKKYLEQEKEKIEIEIETVKGLLGSDVDKEARQELAQLERQKDELEKVLNENGRGEVNKTGSEENFSNIILEIRPGVGGDEAKIWAGDLERMYLRFAESRGWKTELLDEGVLSIRGKNAFSTLKWETGVHRVQRVPKTEASGRIHTSTASVVVLPEVTEKEIEIKEDDLSWEFSRAGGHGGQNVNKVATAVRLTHKPSGMVVRCRQERSQEQNRKIALALLRAQMWENERESRRVEKQESRKAIGRSMRAEKIRTYNYPQNRVTDHRIGKNWHKLDRIIEGDLGAVIESLAYV
ncbi:MAG: Peptide chain release factor 1 [Candidatus Amesbacteria bacterium GW2011_GWB1_47_19]|nr:MAG: Peptide chain release factor 1 [Candidatus Amesbacteria bacterium GW2011_GWA1_44_24]KKU31603.1 MAG: Peptide chain release factor 1 [Candidatus Amesbacteria bacterium GW2011_GWC1_46_24]KKU67376.1 MAG: Peptide chain release factor 1 [Candidatus Amesbacteria bacterium GW2011_GWB1_47_19]OGD05408.1 MAG: hypothetical protein A2379_05515 [Candidatus Amesbacteria bacterium RIFOXYB1_FULL_47_13]HBC72574.1 peptide chain release factor 1 [Candidatus Amesbacteria bacterium]